MSGADRDRTSDKETIGHGGGGRGGTAPDCAIVEQTVVNSPNPDVVPTLTVGDRLAVERKKDQAHRPLLVALNKGKEVVGSLTPRRLHEILACIDLGTVYVAVVMSRSGGKVGVEIRPVAK